MEKPFNVEQYEYVMTLYNIKTNYQFKEICLKLFVWSCLFFWMIANESLLENNYSLLFSNVYIYTYIPWDIMSIEAKLAKERMRGIYPARAFTRPCNRIRLNFQSCWPIRLQHCNWTCYHSEYTIYSHFKPSQFV